ncbi:DUF3683 domain-containing protein [Desulfobotulus mexicanus]|uniref:DUF3683 domain-containing protein n=1 Tax=Desulfobotulus mexicanus TaxID=2586642 RepID=A0A5S5MDW8_9BACT|nr:DUF3683 domain-containing protein [Desulfobotulus mexicanus]TYT73901.1 DUF3683 domain-containing protein [Desulfobotulus mexicanus]
MNVNYREIPYNYTSADDRQVICQILGNDIWQVLENLRSQRVTGRSAQLLMRFAGDLFILRRNPFVYEDLINSRRRQQEFFTNVKKDLKAVAEAALNSDVQIVLDRCHTRLEELQKEIREIKALRRKVKKRLAPITGEESIYFDPFSLNSHATDATDWRLCLPFAVIRPSGEDQIPKVLAAIGDMGMHAIPRGAGTGLTGGSVPVRERCLMVNTEKLNHIHGIEDQPFTGDDGIEKHMPVIRLEAGVVTEAAMKAAEARNLVFATDPTSAWACTIGGNIAENAGGKTAVLWGTAIDNLVAFKIAMPDGRFLEVRRTNHPMRKIQPEDVVAYAVKDLKTMHTEEIRILGSEIRKPGLWKDITNKALAGVPGIQKEGCDGVITSAEFILYEAYEEKATCCLEFFGKDMEEASRVIVALSETFENRGEEALMALEHFDDEYIKAIGYKVKAARSEIPKAVLLVDMVAHSPEQLERGKENLAQLLGPYPNTEIFFAKDKAESTRFWQDRKRFGAIAARTNAFKLNEDIVLPLPKLAAFARFAEDYNGEENRYNQRAAVEAVRMYLDTAQPADAEDTDWVKSKASTAVELCEDTHLALSSATHEELAAESLLKEFQEDILELFQGYKKISAEIAELISAVRSRQIILATHMHAGDGNIHVNIPVFSNDLEMMARANKTADDVMEKAVALGGVVSGEHGIGITKMKYFDKEQILALSQYRKKVDPKNVMNPGKLEDPSVPEKVFTPSFNLLGIEAKILQHGSLKELSDKIAKCVRCGKCKADCCTFYPKQNLFYHPRNKNLAVAALIEAILYDAQRTHTGRFRALRHLEEIADHCTICHKCKIPCPVDIDTGEVSILEREILAALKYKRKALPTRMVLAYLKTNAQLPNIIFRKGVLRYGGEAQRLGAKIVGRIREKSPFHIGKASFSPLNPAWVRNLKPMQLLDAPMPSLPKETLRDVLPACGPNQVLLMEPQGEASATVFYFPGCGSERLHSVISRAGIYILLKAGIRVVLPPPYLCCSFPATVNAETLQRDHLHLRNTILFNQTREMLGYLTFDACVVTCGTCKEALEELGTTNIFNCPVRDVSRFVMEKGLEVPKEESLRLYHAPCHDSMEGNAIRLFRETSGETLKDTPHCCSEAGTMALSRTDITNRMRLRKHSTLQRTLKGLDSSEPPVLLTNCPSCIQGLGRNMDLGIIPRHITEELALRIGGLQWEKELKRLLANTDAINI